jgi:hypothetical protein
MTYSSSQPPPVGGGGIIPPFTPPGASPDTQNVQELQRQVSSLTADLINVRTWIQQLALRVPPGELQNNLWNSVPKPPGATSTGGSGHNGTSPGTGSTTSTIDGGGSTVSEPVPFSVLLLYPGLLVASSVASTSLADGHGHRSTPPRDHVCCPMSSRLFALQRRMLVLLVRKRTWSSPRWRGSVAWLLFPISPLIMLPMMLRGCRTTNEPSVC